MPLRPGAAAFTPAKTTLKASAKPWVPPGFMKTQEERKRAEQKRQQEAKAKRLQEQKRIEEERRRKEEEERRKKEEQERQKKEEEARQKKEEEARQKKEEEEARQKKEEEETKQKEAEEERKRLEEEKKAEAGRTKSPAKYDTAFLLSFEKRFTDTPKGLPDTGAYLKKGYRPRGKGRDFNRRDRDRRQDSGRGGHRGGRNDRRPHGQGRDRRNGKRRGPKQDAPMDIEIKELEKTENRYVIKKDVAADEKLMRSVNSILNKLTPEKFQKLTEQFVSLSIDSPSRLRDVVSAIFEKALSEANFCPTYAAFCQVLHKRLPEFQEEGVKTSFKRLLLTQCQQEFEKEGVYDEQELEKLTSQEDKDLYVLKAKQRRLGTIRFIGELYLHKLIVRTIVHSCYTILLKNPDGNPDEENLQALCRLLATVGKMITQSERGQPNPQTKSCLASMKSFIDRKLVKQSRVRFAIQDILDMSRNGWVARIEKESAKTIEEIHKAAERDKRQEERDRIKQDRRRQFDAKHVMRGPAGPSKNKTYHSNARRAPVSRRRDADGWESNATPMKGKRGGRNQSQDVRTEETSSRQRGGWGKGPRSPPNKKGGRGGRGHGNDEKKKAKPRGNIFDMMTMLGAEEEDEEKDIEEKAEEQPEAELTEDQRTKIVKDIKAFIDEYFMARDLSEAKLCVEELSSQILNHNIVFEGMMKSFEKKEADREALRKMYDYFVTESVLSASDITTGFNEMMEWANDTLPDHPLLFKMLGKFLSTFVVHAKAPISLAYLWSQPTEQLNQNRSKFALGTFAAVKEAKDEKTLVSLVKATNKPLSDLGFTAEALTAGGFACLA